MKKVIIDADVRRSYADAMDDVIEALNAHPRLSDAEFIEDKGAVFVFAETEVGKAALYFPDVVRGGLMSDRQLADATEHAKDLAEQIRERIVGMEDRLATGELSDRTDEIEERLKREQERVETTQERRRLAHGRYVGR